MGEKIYGLLGRKLGHSYSVPIHRALGNEAYRLYELEPKELASFVRREDIGGLNVTIPYKRDVMAFCDGIAPEARAVGSVNTLVRRTDGTLYAWNTDVAGFLFMVSRAGIALAGRKVLLFGSGGASLAVRAACGLLGAAKVVTVSRSGPDNYGNLDRHRDAEILVNTTPLGMYPQTGALAADPGAFPACRGVLDVIYNPRRTALLLRAEELGLPHSDGLPMLVAQAKAAEECFFDHPIDDAENKRILMTLRRETQNIVLIGMPGSGKSAVGAALVQLTGRETMDIDAEVEKRAGCSITELFAKEGEAAFRDLEREETDKAGRRSGMIIVTGGGVVKDERNYAALHQNGRIYQLTRDVGLLPREGRPLSQGADLTALYREREPLYARFRDASIENGGPVEETAAAVWRDFCENCGD